MRVLACLLAAASFLPAEDPLPQVFKRAVAALNSGDYTVAEAGFQQVLKASPNYVRALQNLGVVYSRTGRTEDAIATYRKALRFSPNDKSLQNNLDIAYLKKCRTASAGGRFEEAAMACHNFPGAHRELGKVMVSQHDPAASKELEAAVRESPDDPEAYYLLGVALLQEDRYAEASARLDRAMQLDPNFWGSYFYLGKAKLQLQRPGEALPLLEKASQMNPSAAVVFYELGRALMAAGKTEEAERAMQRVRELRALELSNDAKALGVRIQQQ